MQDSMENDACGLRKRSVGQDYPSPGLPLNVQMAFQAAEGVIKSNPSSSSTKDYADDNGKPNALIEFRKKQKSFEIYIEDCDEEELSGASDDEEGDRPITPAPPPFLPDSCGNVVYKESTSQDFQLAVTRDTDGLTDVSEGESENDDDEDDEELPENSVIKKTPS